MVIERLSVLLSALGFLNGSKKSDLRTRHLSLVGQNSMNTHTKLGLRFLASILLLPIFFYSNSAIAVEAPQPFVSGPTISWVPVNAQGINVHRGNGEYLTSLPGTSTQWTTSESGQYFLVSTDSGSWTNWGRSQVVDVNIDSPAAPGNSGSGFAPSAPQNFRIDVYSQSALELFWDHASDFASLGVTYRIRQDGEIVAQGHNGSSWFVDGLVLGRSYRFQIEAIASSSASSEVLELVVSTPGGSERPVVSTTPSSGTNTTLSAPANVIASVYSETAAEVFWDRSESASNNFIEYHIFLNEAAVGITQGTSFFFDDLLSGTDYIISIEANTRTTNSASDVIMFTTPGAFRLAPVGRPLADAKTHGFRFWDFMTFEQQQRWPSDCLFAGNQFTSVEFGGVIPNVCFSPLRRELIHQGLFRFSLPGDNETNHVEAIEWVSAGSIALIADITTEFGQSQFELSLFRQNGNFVFTRPVLETITNPVDGSPVRGINLDGKDILERRDGSAPRAGEVSSRIYVIGEYYEMSNSGNPDNIGGWAKVGAFAAKIDTSNGQLLSEIFYPGRSQESITRDELPDFLFTF